MEETSPEQSQIESRQQYFCPACWVRHGNNNFTSFVNMIIQFVL